MCGKWNILWISFEDTNPFYGCYGDTRARTPQLDRLASQGCLWTNAFSTAGVCAPARSAIITGMYPVSIGTHHMRTTHTNESAPELPTPYSAVIPHYVKCFTEYLRDREYFCTNNDKTDYQFEPPFTAWDECSPEAHWRNRPDPSQPFFAVFNLMKTHESGMWEQNCPEIKFDPEKMILPPYFPDTRKVRKAFARMYTHIEYNDHCFGTLLEQLEQDGLSDTTIVFHFSDHGPLPRGKRWPYDSGIHIPMIIRWPGHLKPGSINKNLISTIDLAPAVLSILGIKIPPHIHGKAFLGSQAESPRKFVYISRDRHDESYDMVRAIRDHRYKYIKHYYPDKPYLLWVPYRNKHPILQEMQRLYLESKLKNEQLLMFQNKRSPEELYDTCRDPFEVNNLAYDPKYRKLKQRLARELETWQHEVGDMGAIPETEMVKRWYSDGKQPETAAPLFIPMNKDNSGISDVNTGSYKAPVLLQLYCATQGASIGYQINNEEKWRLYTGPIRLQKGEIRIQAKAIRIGYKESKVNTGKFIIE